MPPTNVTIELRGENRTVVPDENGSYTFTGVSPGEYTILVSGGGFVPQVRTMDPLHTEFRFYQRDVLAGVSRIQALRHVVRRVEVKFGDGLHFRSDPGGADRRQPG
jgi:hypothetical protein